MPVTQQGLAAEKQLFTDVDAIRDAVVSHVREQEPIAPTRLAEFFEQAKDTRKEVTREAIWQLVDENLISLDDELRLVLPGK